MSTLSPTAAKNSRLMSMYGRSVLKRIDWLTVLFYLLLVAIGWVNIYSSTFSEESPSIFSYSQLYGKQLVFMGISLVAVILVLALEASFYERFASLLYIISLLSLLGLFLGLR